MFRTWKNEQDIDTVVDMVIAKRDNEKFFNIAESFMLRALCLYVYETQQTPLNLSNVVTLVKNVDENHLACLIKQLKEQNPQSKAVMNWENSRAMEIHSIFPSTVRRLLRDC